MCATLRRLLLCLALALASAQSLGSTRVAIYAIIDDVEFEPSSFEPERVWISGAFVTPMPISSGLHAAPARGSLYFSLHAANPSPTRNDWEALEAHAGSGRVVGFGEYWMPCSRSRSAGGGFPMSADSNCSFEVTIHADRTLAAPDPYPTPSSEGIVTAFDHDDDICPRFGLPSVRIISALRKLHSPDVPQPEPPVCAATLGLIASSDLGWAFAQQDRDEEWAVAAESLLLDRFADVPGLKLANLRVECRDTICRILFSFPTKEYQETVGARLAADALTDLPGFAPGGKIIPYRDALTFDYYLQRAQPAAAAPAD
jgi:hypothetical protein